MPCDFLSALPGSCSGSALLKREMLPEFTFSYMPGHNKELLLKAAWRKSDTSRAFAYGHDPQKAEVTFMCELSMRSRALLSRAQDLREL